MTMWIEACFIQRFLKLGFCSIRGNAIFASRGEFLKDKDLEIVDIVCTYVFPKQTCRN